MLPYHLLLTCVEDNCLADLLNAKNDLYQGGDIGRHNHPTVLATGEQVGDVLWLRRLERLLKMEFRRQLEIAGATISLPQFRGGAYDKTGMGEMPIEELQRIYGEYRIEGVKFTAELKHELAIGLRRAFEDRAIRIPNDTVLLNKLNSVKANYGTNNIPRYEATAEDESHGDEFWALALLVRRARKHFDNPGSMHLLSGNSSWERSNGMRRERSLVG
jgi:phage FluMu gp28-like protein